MRSEVEVRTGAGARLEKITDRADFAALAESWNALVADTDDQVFYRHEFFQAWLDSFAPTAVLRILVIRGPGQRLEAVLPLYEQRANLYGVPVRELCAVANQHSCRFDLIARDPAQAAETFMAYLAADRSWDLLRLTDVPQEGTGFALLAAAWRHGLPAGQWESLRSPFIQLPRKMTELLTRLKAKFKANLRRRRRKLEEKGQLSLERVAGGAELEQLLAEGFALERSGWKGKEGTAIAQDEATRGFYTELAQKMSQLGALALYFLRLDGRVIGFHYALEYGGRYLLLKPAYDESLKEYSPGQLMMDAVLQACIERGLQDFDFLGPDMLWKRDWTERVRPHFYLFIFRRGVLGRALANAKFWLVPAVKARLQRWKR